MSIGIGTKLGQYEVQDFIGQGAMGVVYRAYHAQLARTGAVKVLQAIAPDPDSTARFRHEAQAIAQMRHPNILNVYDFGEFEGTPYMIVEYVPGGNLANRMSPHQLDQASALKYLRGVASGLDYAHGLGIVHRDVKPANVLLEKDDTPVLADFGLAKLLQGSSLKSMTGVTTGTPAYVAPEQVTGSKVGPAADRYSLATIAYEMLTGVIPFDGEGLMELLYAQVHREPTPPSARNSGLGPKVDAVLMRGLAKDPMARWESGKAFVDALAAALAGKPEPSAARTIVMPRAITSTTPLAAAAAAIAAPALAEAEKADDSISVAFASPPPPAPKRKSHRGLIAALVAIGLILLLVIGAAGYLATRGPNFALSLGPSTVVAGDSVLVTASHLPASQSGEIRLHSEVLDFPFRADASGNLNRYITVPSDAATGSHLVEICWAGTCHASAPLQVSAPVALATPTAGASPSATPSAPRTSPTPQATASPTAQPRPVVTLLSISATGTFTIKLQYFTAGSRIIVVVIQAGQSHYAGTVPITSSDFRATVRTPPGIAPLVQAYVVACNSVGNSCFASAPIAVKT